MPAVIDAMPACKANSSEPLVDINAKSSCTGGDAYTCTNQAPKAITETLAIGFAASPGHGDVCGRCYQLEFIGEGKHDNDNTKDPGSRALKGKTMIVQATNIGHDVANGQIDIMIPGGGVGAFDGCSKAWGLESEQEKKELGEQYGGLLHVCKQQYHWNGTHEQYKSCVRTKCQSLFGSRGLTEMEQGCYWFVDWFEAADNPLFKYKEISCPIELIEKSGMDRRVLNDVNNQCGL